MLFNSFAYALFLPIVFLLYWNIPHQYRWGLLLASSYYFYMSWNPKYIVLILFTTIVSYVAARLLEKEERYSVRRLILTIALLACLGVLFLFKYYNFFSENIVAICRAMAINLQPTTLDLLLPVGISFYTFQTLSYVVDVYNKKVPVEHHFGIYATFISFFPQLVAGPIERTSNLLPQIKGEHTFDYDQATYGLKLMVWGFFKKLVIADVLSPYVQMVYNEPTQFRGFALVLASLFFTIQIYCDFSGYSDIAIGTAKLLGINLMTNFKTPYLSASIKEFWSRWHISLSTWFRDYVYIPLGGNRVGSVRGVINLLVTFLISGLWHGANWTFVVWGGLHGIAQAVENILGGKAKRDYDGIVWLIRVVCLFCFCSFAWIFFVSKSLPDAYYVITHLFDGIEHPLLYLRKGSKDIALGRFRLNTILVSVLVLTAYDYVSLKNDVIEEISRWSTYWRWLVYILIAIFIVCLAPVENNSEFIYFQF